LHLSGITLATVVAELSVPGELDMPTIDINCDMGESYGKWQMGHDEEVMAFISSANIACGGHAGDPSVMERTVLLARHHGVAVGAHPGYPDLIGFGRRVLPLSSDELRLSILAQVGALYAIAHSCGVDLAHIKPHGALYNRACTSELEARAIAAAVYKFSTSLPLFCPPGSQMEACAREIGLETIPEGFIDRHYEPNGLLADRNITGAVLGSPEEAAQQALLLASGTVIARGSIPISMPVRTLCVHGDNPAILELLTATSFALRSAGYEIAGQ
jgi:UPF0271 protein